MTVDVEGYGHVGIRVADLDRSVAFYAKLGFTLARWFAGPRVAILTHPSGVEINLIVNADPQHDGRNVLMDEAPKLAGITHLSLRVASTDAVVAQLDAAGIPLSGGPERQGDVAISTFVRDPDRTVVEFTEVI